MDAPGCPTCTIYRPDADPRLPDRPAVCGADRQRMARDLHDVVDLHARLVNDDHGIRPARPAVELDAQGRRALVWAAGDVQAGPIRGKTDQPHVSGSRDAPVPVDLTVLDLTGPARPAAVEVRWRGDHAAVADDQIGHLSVATELDWWVREWRAELWPDHHLPVPTVPELAAWLGNRLDVACDRHPAIDEFAATLRRLRGVLRAAAGEVDPPPTPVIGVACRDCDLRALIRRPGDAYEAECGACGLLYTRAELHDWERRLAGYERSRRSADEIAALLRPNRQVLTSDAS